MKVWLVETDGDPGDRWVIGIYSSLEAADAACRSQLRWSGDPEPSPLIKRHDEWVIEGGLMSSYRIRECAVDQAVS